MLDLEVVAITLVVRSREYVKLWWAIFLCAERFLLRDVLVIFMESFHQSPLEINRTGVEMLNAKGKNNVMSSAVLYSSRQTPLYMVCNAPYKDCLV